MSSLALIPWFELGKFESWLHSYIKVPIHMFGLIVAIGVILGNSISRKYSLKFNCDDDDFRFLSLFVLITGFIGAHVFDVLFYQWDKLQDDPMLMLRVWDGIASYGGFLGGTLGFFFYVWWKRLQVGLWSDIMMVSLLPAFSVGRIGCTVASDHLGGQTDFFLGFDYPGIGRFHNLGFYEFLYLVPLNAVILWLAFKSKKRMAAGSLAILAAMLYTPVRFFLDYLRIDATHDPRYAGLTFAQWMSVVIFVAAGIGLKTVLSKGKPALTSAELGDKVGGRVSVAAAGRR